MAVGVYTKEIGIAYRVAFLYYNKVMPHGDFFAQVAKSHTVKLQSCQWQTSVVVASQPN